jgi:hypothetical protein
MILATNCRTYVRSFQGQQDAQENNTLLAMQSRIKPEIKNKFKYNDPAVLLCLDKITNLIKTQNCGHSDPRVREKFSWHDMIGIDESAANKLASLTDSKKRTGFRLSRNINKKSRTLNDSHMSLC